MVETQILLVIVTVLGRQVASEILPAVDSAIQHRNFLIVASDGTILASTKNALAS